MINSGERNPYNRVKPTKTTEAQQSRHNYTSDIGLLKRLDDQARRTVGQLIAEGNS